MLWNGSGQAGWLKVLSILRCCICMFLGFFVSCCCIVLNSHRSFFFLMFMNHPNRLIAFGSVTFEPLIGDLSISMLGHSRLKSEGTPSPTPFPPLHPRVLLLWKSHSQDLTSTMKCIDGKSRMKRINFLISSGISVGPCLRLCTQVADFSFDRPASLLPSCSL